MAHTPGKWTLLDGEHSIIVGGGPNNDDIAEFFFADTTSVSISREEAVANARLFLAAPDLLEALRNLVGLAEMRPGKLHEYKAAIADARAALAKAEG